MKIITVFTTTYNRAHLLPRLYESLCAQTNTDFIWLIVDDGSTDDTNELVHKWIAENKIEITYIYKENGGMHTGHNVAYENIHTDYNICIDSDDFLLTSSIETITALIKEFNVSNDDTLAGLVGLNITTEGKVIGNKFPKDVLLSKFQDISRKHNAIGDKKIVYKTKNIHKLTPYPAFPPEKFVPLYYPILLDAEFDYLCINQNFCVVEYQDDGSTINIFNQYIKNPQGFRHSRAIEITYCKNYKSKFKSAMHLISSNMILKETNLCKGSPNTLLTILALPFGIAWYFKVKSMMNSKRDISTYIK